VFSKNAESSIRFLHFEADETLGFIVKIQNFIENCSNEIQLWQTPVLFFCTDYKNRVLIRRKSISNVLHPLVTDTRSLSRQIQNASRLVSTLFKIFVRNFSNVQSNVNSLAGLAFPGWSHSECSVGKLGFSRRWFWCNHASSRLWGSNR